MHHAQMVAAMRACVNRQTRHITQPGTVALSFDTGRIRNDTATDDRTGRTNSLFKSEFVRYTDFMRRLRKPIGDGSM